MSIKEKSMELFSNETIFYNFNGDLLDKYKDFYSIEEVQSVLKDEELIATANAFFDNSLNVSSTSKAAFMHRNTLIYRLDKIKKLTGLDIRIFKEAVVFGNFILFYRLIKNELN